MLVLGGLVSENSRCGHHCFKVCLVIPAEAKLGEKCYKPMLEVPGDWRGVPAL